MLSSTGLGPEVFSWISPDGNFTGGDPPTEADLEFYNENGFYVRNNASWYILRPEVLESNFHAWRVTGDEKYLDRALAGAQSLENFCKVNNAYAGIGDVRVTNSGFIDDTQSFFFAEVMKYLYVVALRSFLLFRLANCLFFSDISLSMTRITLASTTVSLSSSSALFGLIY